jgi:hypothetical protein
MKENEEGNKEIMKEKDEGMEERKEKWMKELKNA